MATPSPSRGDDLAPDDLATRIGAMLRQRRERVGLTQQELADLAGTSQASVARIERGDRAPSVGMVERLSAAIGCFVQVTLEPLHQQVDETIAALAAVPIETRVADAGVPDFADDLSPVPHVFTGTTAALLQGVPVPVDRMEIALARCDCDAFVAWLSHRYGARWHRHYEGFGMAPLDPREPGENLWRIIGGVVIRVELDDELPPSIEVRHGQRIYRVVPLADVEVVDPGTARLLSRYREQRAAGQEPDPSATSSTSYPYASSR